jgi:hypothetical protein
MIDLKSVIDFNGDYLYHFTLNKIIRKSCFGTEYDESFSNEDLYKAYQEQIENNEATLTTEIIFSFKYGVLSIKRYNTHFGWESLPI